MGHRFHSALNKILFCLTGSAALAVLGLFVYTLLPTTGYHLLVVTSGSMQPTIESGDLIVISPAPAALKPGMILTLAVNGELVTHRLVSFNEQEGIITQGDANPVPDAWEEDARVQIVGLYRGRIPKLGFLMSLPTRLVSMVGTGAWFTDAGEISMKIGSGIWGDPTVTPTPDPSLGGTSIDATVTAEGFTEMRASGRVYGVRGEVCVTNNGKVITQNLQIDEQVQAKVGKGGFQDIPGARLVIMPSEQLDPGESACYPYAYEFIPILGASYRNSVNVTITNHSNWLVGSKKCPGPKPCPFGPNPKADFSLPEAPLDAPRNLEVPDEPVNVVIVDVPTETPTPEPTMTPSPTETATTVAPTETQTVEPTATETPEPSRTPEATETDIPPTEVPTLIPTETVEEPTATEEVVTNTPEPPVEEPTDEPTEVVEPSPEG